MIYPVDSVIHISNNWGLVENNELTSDPTKVAEAFNLAFVNIAQKYIDVSLQGTPDLQKLRSFVSKMKPSGELFNIPPITSCFV